MIPLDTALLFLAATLALAATPGPDNLFVLTQSALYGRAAGVLVVLGLCTGVLIHTAAVALGVAAIFATSMLAFNALKLLGAAYLLYLAWGAFRAMPTTVSSKDDSKPSGHLYLRGVVMNVTNPKVAIFFLAFLPQFAVPSNGPLPVQIAQFGILFMVSTMIVFGAVAWFAGRLGNWLRKSSRAQSIMNRTAGAIFVALAIRLAVAER